MGRQQRNRRVRRHAVRAHHQRNGIEPRLRLAHTIDGEFKLPRGARPYLRRLQRSRSARGRQRTQHRRQPLQWSVPAVQCLRHTGRCRIGQRAIGGADPAYENVVDNSEAVFSPPGCLSQQQRRRRNARAGQPDRRRARAGRPRSPTLTASSSPTLPNNTVRGNYIGYSNYDGIAITTAPRHREISCSKTTSAGISSAPCQTAATA